MADRDITIGIQTQGAARTAQDIGRVEDSIEDLGRQAPRTAAQMDQLADSTRQMGTSGAYNKGGGNAGTAILEASRALEDLQFGLRGVLNNIPSLIFALGGSAGLAGVISVAAVSASVLWTKFSGGAKKAKEDTGDLIETFKQLVEVYTELDQTNAEDRQKAAETAAKGLQTAINSISLGQLITGNRAGLTAAREVAAASLQLAQDRNRLAEVEKATTFASGNDAVRLAKEREAIVARILDSERAITEAGRQRELSNAADKVAGAQAKVDATKGPDAELNAQAQDLSRRITDLQAQADAATARRLLAVEEASAALTRNEREIQALRERAKDITLGELEQIKALTEAAALKLQQGGLRDELARLQQAGSAEINPLSQAANLQASLDKLKPQLDASAEAQREAARAMTEATLALSNLRQSQDISRTSEAELKATEEIGRVGQDVTQAARDAIAAIQANAAQQGRAPNAGEQESISGIQRIITDTTPDAQQGGQLAGLIQVLANNLTAKDAVLAGGINQIITTAKTLASKYQGLADRINDLQNQVNQLK